MKITDIRVHMFGATHADSITRRRNWIFVEVQTDEGINGIGEATTEYHEMAVKAQIETELRPRLIGQDPTDIERIWTMGFRDFWWRAGVVHTSAMSGVDMALWDIKGKAAGLPVYKLLGGRARDSVRLYARGDLGLPSIADEAVEAVNQGFDAFKYGPQRFVTPFDEMRHARSAIEEAHQIREAVGPGVDIMLDAAGVFSSTAAHLLLDGLIDVPMFFVEEPTNQDTFEPTLRLKRDFPGVKVALGERFNTRWEFREWFEKQAIDVCQVDISHTGGISELMKVAHFAEVYGIQIAPHNPYGPVALAAAAHCAAAMQNFLILEHCRYPQWWEKVQKTRVPISRGAIAVDEMSKSPGLGVEIDLEFITATSFVHVPLATRQYIQEDGSWPLI